MINLRTTENTLFWSIYTINRYFLRGIEIFRLNKHCSVIGVSLAESHPMWCFKIEGGNMRPFIKGDGLYMRSKGSRWRIGKLTRSHGARLPARISAED